MLAQPIREDSVAAAVRPEVEACIRGLLADHLGVDVERIAPGVSLVEDLAADSLDLVEIALAIEGLARITPPGTPPPWTVERVILLTPYAAQTLSDDALRAGWGARLELTLAADASVAALTWVRGQFPRLGDRGVELQVRRDQRMGRRRRNAA